MVAHPMCVCRNRSARAFERPLPESDDAARLSCDQRTLLALMRLGPAPYSGLDSYTCAKSFALFGLNEVRDQTLRVDVRRGAVRTRCSFFAHHFTSTGGVPCV